MRLRRVGIAKDLGLDPDEVEHYPVQGDTVVYRGIPGWTVPAIAAIAAATWFGAQYLNREPAPDPQVIRKDYDVDMQVIPPQ